MFPSENIRCAVLPFGQTLDLDQISDDMISCTCAAVVRGIDGKEALGEEKT